MSWSAPRNPPAHPTRWLGCTTDHDEPREAAGAPHRHEQKTKQVPIRLHVEELAGGRLPADNIAVPGLAVDRGNVAEATEIVRGLTRKITESRIEHGPPLPLSLTVSTSPKPTLTTRARQRALGAQRNADREPVAPAIGARHSTERTARKMRIQNAMPPATRPPSRTYWMRSVSFAGLHRLLRAIAATSDGLRAREINALVLDRQVMLTPYRSSPKPTTLYHYRNTLIRLGALTRDGLRLRPNLDNPDVVALLDEEPPSHDARLSDAAREHFAALVLHNHDCRTLFFDLFMPCDRPWNGVTDFRENAAPLTWARRRPDGGHATIAFRNHATGRTTDHPRRAGVPAVLYGLRYWARDELELVDEYSTRSIDRTTLFPVLRPPSSPDERQTAIRHAVRFLLSLRPGHSQGEWTMLSVSDLIVEYCETHRQPRNLLFAAIHWLQREWPGHTSLVPTPLRLATVAASSPQQENLALRRYYKPADGPYVSHIRFHRDVTADAAHPGHHHA